MADSIQRSRERPVMTLKRRSKELSATDQRALLECAATELRAKPHVDPICNGSAPDSFAFDRGH
jgi:hypothetical protein